MNDRSVLYCAVAVVATIVSCLFLHTAFSSYRLAYVNINILLAILFIVSAFCWIQAMRRLTTLGQDQFWYIVIWSKLAAGRENFTTEGWRYWILLRCNVLSFVVLFVFRLFMQK